MPTYNPTSTQSSKRSEQEWNSPSYNYSAKSGGIVKVDPAILRAARQVYRQYVDSYSSQLPRPLGIAVNRRDMSGKLIYTQLILLPQETFVPIELIEASDR